MAVTGLDSQILFEDAALVVLNKPSGLLTLPDRFDPKQENLRQLLIQRYGTIFVVHRLDRGTSGVIVFAKTAAAHRHLSRQFGAHQVHKCYHALVHGVLPQPVREITLRLAPDPRRKGLVHTHRFGKAAHTRATLLESYRTISLLQCEPRTGRQHQIRVHLHAIGHPLLVDPEYGKTETFQLSALKPHYRLAAGTTERPLIARLTLHAFQLTLNHPLTDAPITFEAPYPKDFRATVQMLRKYGKG
ncbi:MAG: RluA family pseudouridine synthase [Deltaproteobacteria bacterium]|nr:RluA family pseudouridine synthase [Deltaproteobacteria bacterium]